MAYGVVKWFNAEKGYGWIAPESGADVFVEWRSISGDGFRSLRDGQRVRFDLTDDGSGSAAVRVEPLN